ncbi:hypothetical protein HD553DRAFT_146203 [Filobasidium floriforme]|uniref:uncharacterized protein n=1 Tax=Filobasidium floriforme TaxID=5210 RepID=UPI001E8ECD60|nr:uncharacterized protein HD553DRAFT_146203 [Filobasidium floriforme]KAH8078270.1 hypothetical protein HD553DRAFT_146203 [Filobasidium floriforme]
MDSIIEISDGEDSPFAGPSRLGYQTFLDDDEVVVLPSSDGLDDLPDLRTLTANRSILPKTYQPVLSGGPIATQSSDIDQFTSPIQPPIKAKRKAADVAMPARNRQRSTVTTNRSSSSLSPVPEPEIEPERAYNPPSSPIPLRKNLVKKRTRPVEKDLGLETDDPVVKKSRTKDKEQEKVDKAAAKARLQAEKQAEKVNKKRSTEVNKLRTSKSETLREIKMYLSHDLTIAPSPVAVVLPALRDKFREYFSEIEPLEEGGFPGLIKFKRIVRANWDEGRGIWIPVDQEKEGWVEEGLVIVFIKADELVEKIRLHLDIKAGKSQPGDVPHETTLEGWIEQLKDDLKVTCKPSRLTTEVPPGQKPPTYPRDREGLPGIMLVIHGMKAYHSKTRSAAQREFAARTKAALAEIEGNGNAPAADTGDKGKKKATSGKGKNQVPRLEKEDIERELVAIHLRHGWLQVQVDTPAEISEWLYNMSADLAIRPYKLISKSHTLPLGRENNLKASSKQHALELMLQEIPGVTPSGSVGIAEEWKSFRRLMEGFEKKAREEGVGSARILLEGCKVRHLKTGVQNERNVGRAVSTHIHNALRESDPTFPV